MAYLEDKDRDVIPRWRDFKTTVALGELGTDSRRLVNSGKEAFQYDVSSKLLAWSRFPSIGVAADLVSSADLFPSRSPVLLEAAEYLLKDSSRVSRPLGRLARQLIDGETARDDRLIINSTHVLPTRRNLARKIHVIKRRLLDQPRNSILYVEKARLYTLLAESEKAKHSMLMAVKLSPSNRFVLRSAARLFIHVGEFKLAHDILRYSDQVKFDSWLLAAEISVASAVNHSARFMKQGLELIKSDNFSPFDTTELSAAIAMQEFEHGKNRAARGFVQKAMRHPTENSLAQVAWATRRKLLPVVETSSSGVPRAYETLAWESVLDRKWSDALAQSLLWHLDQPFSSRPISLAAYISSSILKNYEEGIRILKIGLTSNPRHAMLLNTLAFSYASSDQPDQANEVLGSVDRSSLSDEDTIYLNATAGLIAFRSGDPDRGRHLYRTAIAKAEDMGKRRLSVRAYIFYVREEVRLNPENRDQLVNEAYRLIEESGEPELKLIADVHLAGLSETNSRST
jgi:tetratricopeptide (TPR) repeat protein